jgi:hypothetical protein
MTMKRSIFRQTAIALLMAAITFTGCNKDDDDGGDTSPVKGNRITATVDGVSDKVDEVTASATSWSAELIASAEFKDNGFSMELPSTVSNNSLRSVSTYEPEGVILSDPTVKWITVDYLDAEKEGRPVGYFNYQNIEGNNEIYGYFYYVDKDVTIAGEGVRVNGEYFAQYRNCHLKKGWNCVAEIYKGQDSNGRYVYELTTTLPAGLKWVFEPLEK